MFSFSDIMIDRWNLLLEPRKVKSHFPFIIVKKIIFRKTFSSSGIFAVLIGKSVFQSKLDHAMDCQLRSAICRHFWLFQNILHWYIRKSTEQSDIKVWNYKWVAVKKFDPISHLLIHCNALISLMPSNWTHL